MRGVCKNNCQVEMDPPQYTVVISSLEEGTVIGYFCNAQCAKEDAGTFLDHISKNGNNVMNYDPGSSRDVIFQDRADQVEGKQRKAFVPTPAKLAENGITMLTRDFRTLRDISCALAIAVYEHKTMALVSELDGENPWVVYSDVPVTEIELSSGQTILGYNMQLLHKSLNLSVTFGYSDFNLWVEIKEHYYHSETTMEPVSINISYNDVNNNNQSVSDLVASLADTVVMLGLSAPARAGDQPVGKDMDLINKLAEVPREYTFLWESFWMNMINGNTPASAEGVSVSPGIQQDWHSYISTDWVAGAEEASPDIFLEPSEEPLEPTFTEDDNLI